MTRSRVASAAAALAVAGAAATAAAAYQGRHQTVVASGKASENVVVALGKDYWEPNAYVAATFRWEPSTITVRSGDTVTFVHGSSPEPHTVTLSTKAQLPHSFESPCAPCMIAAGHLRNPNGPPSPSNVKAYVLNKGRPGLDALGDSIGPPPKGPHARAAIVVSAPAGTVLHFVCAIHPWMQGRIVVTS